MSAQLLLSPHWPISYFEACDGPTGVSMCMASAIYPLCAVNAMRLQQVNTCKADLAGT